MRAFPRHLLGRPLTAPSTRLRYCLDQKKPGPKIVVSTVLLPAVHVPAASSPTRIERTRTEAGDLRADSMLLLLASVQAWQRWEKTLEAAHDNLAMGQRALDYAQWVMVQADG